MKTLTFNVIAAVCENGGIGYKGELPWRLRSEMRYFTKTTKHVSDASKCNAVIMGRKTYFGIPEKFRPLADRVNIVLSSTLNDAEMLDPVMLQPSLEAAMQCLDAKADKLGIENVWVIGGSGVYTEAMQSSRCKRLYLTRVLKPFDCDAYFPEIPPAFKETALDASIEAGVQEENGIQFKYTIWERK